MTLLKVTLKTVGALALAAALAWGGYNLGLTVGRRAGEIINTVMEAREVLKP